MENETLFVQMVSQQIGNYNFRNRNLLFQAFTRRSYTEENGGENNEVLEFIGDKALDIAVVRYLVGKYDNAPKKEIKALGVSKRNPYIQNADGLACSLDEGELTKLKQRLVQKDTLARRIDELHIGSYLRMGVGDVRAKRSQEKSVKEDLFEAIIGAVTIDCNWDLDVIQDVVEVMLNPDSVLKTDEKLDYVSLIYKWDEAKGIVPFFKYFEYGYSDLSTWREPNAIYQKPEGLDDTKIRRTKRTCHVKIASSIPEFVAYGRSKNEARKEACRMAYNYLKEKNLLYSIRDKIKDNSLEMAINNLEILARCKYIAMPKYEEKESHDQNGNPVWNVKCQVKGIEKVFSSKNSSKKKAKKNVAYRMVKYILDNYDGNENL